MSILVVTSLIVAKVVMTTISIATAVMTIIMTILTVIVFGYYSRYFAVVLLWLLVYY